MSNTDTTRRINNSYRSVEAHWQRCCQSLRRVERAGVIHAALQGRAAGLAFRLNELEQAGLASAP